MAPSLSTGWPSRTGRCQSSSSTGSRPDCSHQRTRVPAPRPAPLPCPHHPFPALQPCPTPARARIWSRRCHNASMKGPQKQKSWRRALWGRGTRSGRGGRPAPEIARSSPSTLPGQKMWVAQPLLEAYMDGTSSTAYPPLFSSVVCIPPPATEPQVLWPTTTTGGQMVLKPVPGEPQRAPCRRGARGERRGKKWIEGLRGGPPPLSLCSVPATARTTCLLACLMSCGHEPRGWSTISVCPSVPCFTIKP
jgi:hypothetical protein